MPNFNNIKDNASDNQIAYLSALLLQQQGIVQDSYAAKNQIWKILTGNKFTKEDKLGLVKMIRSRKINPSCKLVSLMNSYSPAKVSITTEKPKRGRPVGSKNKTSANTIQSSDLVLAFSNLPQEQQQLLLKIGNLVS